jgi:hypothetical protein
MHFVRLESWFIAFGSHISNWIGRFEKLTGRSFRFK